MRILAVDDDPFIRELLPVVFRDAQFPDITIAASGAEALSILNNSDRAFECLLLDIQMPQMDGITLCTRIRELRAYRDTPIIMLTANTDRDSIEGAFAAGANDYVTKPFDVKEISNRVRIAKRMIETAGTLPRLDPIHVQPGSLPGQHMFSLEDPVSLANVGQVVLPFSLGNYLSQLSRKNLSACQVFAVRIDKVEDLYKNASTHDFSIALCQVAEAVSAVIDTPRMLMAYEGSGMFMCISPADETPEWPDVEDQIIAVLKQGAAAFEDGTPMNLSVSVGGPMQPNASRTQRVRKSFDRAEARVLVRQNVKYPEADNTQGAPQPV
jgi:DNA-binding response OmpR family regulator